MNLKASFNRLLGLGDESSQQNFFANTRIGDRKNNQDYHAHLFDKKGTLLIVADGLGGHQGGELASRLFCESLVLLAGNAIDDLCSNPDKTIESLAAQATDLMSKTMEEDYPGVDAHTTCAVCWINASNHKLTTLHIGDSRIYRFNEKEIIWRSRDHSVVQMLVDTGQLTEEEMGTHPEQGALTRSIGVGKKTKATVKTQSTPMQPGEALLLCSDGLWEMVSRKEICALAKKKNPEKQLHKLMSAAVKRAAPKSDNVTAELLLF